MKNKKVIILLITLVFINISILSLFVNHNRIKGDSGFDVSYDSSDSYDSGGSYDSSSNDRSYGYDRDYGYSSFSNIGGTRQKPNEIIVLIYFIIQGIAILIMPIISISNKITELKNKKLLDEELAKYNKKFLEEKWSNYNIVESKNNFVKYDLNIDDKIKKYIPNYDEQAFLDERFKEFIYVQEAWMNFDYEALKKLVSNDLYNQYKMQLDVLKLNNQKNIMSDFIYEFSKITEIYEQNNIITVKIHLVTNFFDYIVNGEKIVRGRNDKKVNVRYELTYVCNKLSLGVCPSCHGQLLDYSTQNCPYCKNKIVNIPKKWILTNKKVIYQR